MENLKDLNQLLKDKGERTLNGEISDFITQIKKHKFFDCIEQIKVEVGDSSVKDLRNLFWGNAPMIYEMIRKVYLKEYIESASADFMEKVKEIESDINDLKNQQGD